MTKKEYIKGIKECDVVSDRVTAINSIYNSEISGILANVISFADSIDFFDEERRALSFKEICNPKKYLCFDFVSIGLVPVIDSYDNTYIVYIISEDKWAKFNIVDETLFKKKKSLEELV